MAELLTCKRVLSLMVILSYIIHHMLRINLSIAIVNMVAEKTPNSTSYQSQQRIDWNQEQKNNILGSFYLGYLLTQIPGGRLAEIFGTRIVLGLALLLASFLTLLTPMACNLHYHWALAVRFCLGLCLGVHWPSTPPMASRWIPPEDTSKFMSHGIASSLGAALTLFVCGYLIAYFGWPCVFYVTGSITLIWTLAWFYLVYDSPDLHPRISIKEKNFLKKHVRSDTFIVQKGKTPWKELLTSRPVWAIVVGMSFHTFPFFVILNHLPTYMNEVLHFDIKQNGWLSSLPYLGKYLAAVTSSYAVDSLIKTKKFSKTVIRKAVTAVLFLGPSLFFLIQAYWGYNRTVSVVVFVCAMGLMGLAPSGIFANTVDITPVYSGTVFGISQVFVSTGGYLATTIVSLVTREKQNFQQWSYIFWILIAVNLFGLAVFLIFASGDVQKWNPKAEDTEMKALRKDTSYT